jgi:hypothetical protein
MATTTNYSWSTPDDTALVKDGAAAIRTLGSSIDTTTKALNPSTTLGDIEYRSATANTNTRLALGTAGQVLRVNSGATAPEWATIPAGGKVLQVVMGTTSTSTTIASTTYTDTTLTATITPSATSSKVLCFVSQNFVNFKSSSAMTGGSSIKLVRAGTDIVTRGDKEVDLRYDIRAVGNGIQYLGLVTNIAYLDSPSTTSATIYKTQGAVAYTTDSNQVIYQNGGQSQIILMEIGA